MKFIWSVDSGILDDIAVFDKLDLPYTWIRYTDTDKYWADQFETDYITEIPAEGIPILTNAIVAKYEIKTAKYTANPETPEEFTGILVNDKYTLPTNALFNGTIWSTLLYDFLDTGGAIEPPYSKEELQEMATANHNAKVMDKFNATMSELDVHPMEAMLLLLKYMAVKMYPGAADDPTAASEPILGEITPGGKDIVEWGDVMVDKLYNAVKERNENLM